MVESVEPSPSDPTGQVAQWYRLHPASILIEVVKRVVNLAWFLAIVVMLLVLGDEPSTFEYVIAGIAMLEVFSPILTYLSLRFGVAEDQLVVRIGLIFRRVRTIRLDRIENINLRRGVLHRFFGVAAMTIETAVSGKPEVELAAIPEQLAQRLRAELLTHRDPNRSVTDEDALGEAVWTASSMDLMILGLTENRLPLITGAIGSIWWTFSDLIDPYWEAAKQVITQVAGENLTTTILLAAVLLAAMFLLASLISILLSYVRYHGFTLRRVDDKLGRQHGLFTRHETLLPVGRIQVVRIEQPWLRRRLGLATVHAETAGTTSINQQQGVVPLCPLIRRCRVDEIVRLAFEVVRLDEVVWQRVSRHTITRSRNRGIALLGLLLLAAGYFWTWRVFWGLPLGLLLADRYARARYRSLGYAELEDHLLIRSGVVNQRIWIIPRARLQSVTENQSPNQRRFGIATLVLATAGGNRLEPCTLVDVDHALATGMQDQLSEAANSAGAWPGDGV